MRKRQREIALGVLIFALVAVIAWRVRSATPAPPTRSTSSAAASQAGTPPRDKSAVTGVDLEALKAERPEPEETERNPFRFRPKPAPPPPPKAATTSPTGTPNDPLVTGPVGPPPPPPIPLKFIGLASSKVDPKIGRVAILSDARGVYYGREGDIIEGRYRILKIGVESIDLSYVDGRGRQTIRQTGQ